MVYRRFIVACSVGLAGALIGGAAMADDPTLPLKESYAGSAPGGQAPWVNILFRDFSDSSLPSEFEWIRKTVEVQVTTAPSDGFNQNPCCPVPGLGNLTGQERLTELYLNFNPEKDISKLKIYWTGEPMPPNGDTFPDPGLKPILIEIRENGFTAGGGAGRFDIRLKWGGNAKLGQDGDWSKLLFVYDQGNSELSPADLQVISAGASSPAQPFIAVGRIQNTSGPTANGWIKN